MYKIALFSPVVRNDNSLALLKYKDILKQKLIDNPIIFCDNIEIFIDENIPIFASIYMKQKFRDYIIITDIENIDYIDNTLKIIAIYNSVCQDPKNNNHIKYVSYENDIIPTLQEILL